MAIKFMQSLDSAVYAQLTRIAKERGITMQELIRAVIVPDWMHRIDDVQQKSDSRRPSRHSRPSRRIRAAAQA